MLMGPRPGVRPVCGPRVESWLLGKRWQVAHRLRLLCSLTFIRGLPLLRVTALAQAPPRGPGKDSRPTHT